jgi:hypothetical protein
MEQYFYLWGSFLCILLWLVVFLKNDKSERPKILALGTIFGLISVISEQFLLRDYWNPTYFFGEYFMVEDFIYGFCFGGAVVGLIPLVFHLREGRRSKRAIWLDAIHILIVVLLFLVLTYWLRINSIVPMILSPIIIGVISLVRLKRKDHLSWHLLNGLLAAAITLIIYWLMLIFAPDLFEKYYFMDRLSGVMFLGVPIEETLFAFALGFGATSVSESLYNSRQIKIRKRR